MVGGRLHNSMIEKDFKKMNLALGEAKFLSVIAGDEILKNNYLNDY